MMVLTVGHRRRASSGSGLPIGTLLHLVFDGAWADTDVFWWPFGGWSFDAALPEVARGGWTVPSSRPGGDPGVGLAGSRLSDPGGAGGQQGRLFSAPRASVLRGPGFEARYQ